MDQIPETKREQPQPSSDAREALAFEVVTSTDPVRRPGEVTIPSLHLGRTASENDVIVVRENSNTANIYQRVRDASVRLVANDGEEGSGFFVTSDGCLLTAAHGIPSGTTFTTVETTDGRSYLSRVIDVDRRNDVALLRVLPTREGQTFASIPIRSQELGATEQVASLGHPNGWNRVFMSIGTTPTTVAPDERARRFERWREAQTINVASSHLEPGGSGGPMLDVTGAAVGLTVGTSFNRDQAIFVPSRAMLDILKRNNVTPTLQANLTSNRPVLERQLRIGPSFIGSSLRSNPLMDLRPQLPSSAEGRPAATQLTSPLDVRTPTISPAEAGAAQTRPADARLRARPVGMEQPIIPLERFATPTRPSETPLDRFATPARPPDAPIQVVPQLSRPRNADRIPLRQLADPPRR